MQLQQNTSRIKTDNNYFDQIADTLLLNASFINNIGLMHGKMGISICLFHLAKNSNKAVFETVAGELIDEIYDEISENTSIDFENGLAGIGWGIEYLIQQGFLEANTDEVLDDLDQRIFQELIHNEHLDLKLLNGILGIGAYFFYRIRESKFGSKNKIIKAANLKALEIVLKRIDTLSINVPKIMREPFTQSSSEPERKKVFDITWDYTTLLSFLVYLCKTEIDKAKVTNLVQRLIQHFVLKKLTPELYCNQLLLILSLIKINLSGMEIPELNIREILSITIPTDETRNIIKSELFSNDCSVKNGIAGIVLIYRELYRFTFDKKFLEEADYWINKLKDEVKMNLFQGFGKQENSLGLLTGIAGCLNLFLIPEIH